MKSIKDTKDLNGKRVLLRTDFDVPVKEMRIEETFRIKRQKTTIDFLLNQGATVVMVAHISAISSFEPILSQLEKTIGHKINFIKDTDGLKDFSGLGLLDNIRKWPNEEKNDEEFAKKLTDGFDIYINNAFAVSHRSHASVSAITKFIDSYAGLLVEEETTQLQSILDSPKEGKLIIMGGAKASTKVPVVKNFLDKSEKIILGGVIANDIFKERGMYVDSSIVDENSKELLAGLDIYDERLILAEDFNSPGGKILDIGPKSINNFTNIIKEAKMVIWNGPVGLFENPDYSEGTFAIARTMAELKNFRIIGGGDTISAVDKLGLLDKFSFVSTGGGAMLEFLAGDKLPGLEVLGYYK